MKRNDTGDFCVLYVEPADERESLFLAVLDQKKPVVIMLTDHLRIFQRPEDFSALKHLKRQVDVPIVFVIPGSERLTQLAGRYGFPVYLSMDALANALTAGHLVRRMNRTTSPLDTAEHHFSFNSADSLSADPLRQGTPLPTVDDFLFQKQNTPLLPLSSPYAEPVAPTTRRAQRRLPALIALFTTFIILAASIFSFLALSHKLPTSPAASAATPAIVGHVTFLSSEQLSENSNQGIDDQVLVDLSGLPRPAPQKNYYAWLLSDHSVSDSKAIALGTLPVNNGHAYLLYPGDQQHTNLLVTTSRFLVTEEDSTMPPMSPSPDYSTWRYYGEFSQTPIKSPDNTRTF